MAHPSCPHPERLLDALSERLISHGVQDRIHARVADGQDDADVVGGRGEVDVHTKVVEEEHGLVGGPAQGEGHHEGEQGPDQRPAGSELPHLLSVDFGQG